MREKVRERGKETEREKRDNVKWGKGREEEGG